MEENNKDKILHIPVDDIIPNRFQPRLAFDENELDFNNYCKFYNVIRNEAIIVMDNFVFFSHVLYSSDGKPKHLTGSSFFALKIDNKVADYYLDIFTKTYEESTQLKELSKNEI